MAIIRDPQSGRILGVTKECPPWATEDTLRRIVLLPALRHYAAARQYFGEGRSAKAIAQEMGVSPASVRNYLYRIRRAVGAPKEPIREAKPQLIARTTGNALWQDGLHYAGPGRVHRSKGRKLADDWAADDSLLRETILGPALLMHDIARRYWLLGHSARQIAAAVGLKRKAVQHITEMIRYRAEHPQLEPRVLLARTRAGQSRLARTVLHTLPYKVTQ